MKYLTIWSLVLVFFMSCTWDSPLLPESKDFQGFCIFESMDEMRLENPAEGTNLEAVPEKIIFSRLLNAREYRFQASLEDDFSVLLWENINLKNNFIASDDCRFAEGNIYCRLSALEEGQWSDWKVLGSFIFTGEVPDYPDPEDDGETNDDQSSLTINTSSEIPANLSVSFDKEDGINIKQSSVFSVSVNESFDSYQWLLEGMDLSQETGQSVSFACSALNPGIHRLYVFVEKEGKTYSNFLSFLVEI